MTRTLYAEFADVRSLQSAIGEARRAKVAIVDAFTPFPVEGLGESLGGDRDGRTVRILMLVGGLAAAAFAFGLQYYSAVFGYPFDIGGRPHNSWPTFLLFPFEFGILSAAVFGLVGLFLTTGLPALHHPVFEVPGMDRASNDRFFLALECPTGDDTRQDLEDRLTVCGALAVREVAS